MRSDMHFQVRKMIADIDKDDSGTIDFEEFLQMMTAKMVRLPRHSFAALSRSAQSAAGGICAGPARWLRCGRAEESDAGRVLFVRH
jgi:hypothetical protein